MTHIPAYPLQWPMARPRTDSPKDATFNKKVDNGRYTETRSLSIADALDRLQREIDLLKVDDYVLSTNMPLRLDGLPRSNLGEPTDKGVALYFTLKGKPHCLPCDRYRRVADNIAAIAKHIEATRAIERYGVANMAEMFTAFTALPKPTAHWEILGIKETGDVRVINDAYRANAKERAADEAALKELNLARDAAIRDATGGPG